MRPLVNFWVCVVSMWDCVRTSVSLFLLAGFFCCSIASLGGLSTFLLPCRRVGVCITVSTMIVMIVLVILIWKSIPVLSDDEVRSQCGILAWGMTFVVYRLRLFVVIVV